MKVPCECGCSSVTTVETTKFATNVNNTKRTINQAEPRPINLFIRSPTPEKLFENMAVSFRDNFGE